MIPFLSRVRQRRLSARSYRRIVLVALWAIGFIIVTGGAVRLTGSGLGCPDWPTCAHNRVVAPWHYHAVIEFGNRVVTAVVSIGVIAAVLGSLLRRPRRRDLTWLSWGLVAGIFGQAVLGGLAVKHHLDPPYVMAHFLLSLVLLADAVVLHHRAGFDDGPPDDQGRARPGSPPSPLVPERALALGRLLVVLAGMVIVLGTVVTSTGPHGGDPTARRFDYSLHDVARLHSGAVLAFVGLTVLTLWVVARAGAPPSVVRRGELLLAVLLFQGALGYLQYFSGVPSWIVAVHITMAAVVWAVTLQFLLGLSARAAAAPPPAPAPVAHVLATA